jgi:uncharacterized membrane protein/uncharacterized membrane protein YeaQ/YmgE (transglycosylase-associated protein family)
MPSVLTWIVTGVFVGWIVRLAMKTRRDFGLLGDLITGSLGAVVGGWVLELLGVPAMDNLAEHVVVAVVGAMILLGALRLLRSAMSVAGLPAGPNFMPTVADLEAQVARLGDIERRALSIILRRGLNTPDPNRSFDAQLSFGERVADRVAAFGGSWTFIGLFLTAMTIWMAANRAPGRAFDPYPFILLNLVLSCVAALQAPVIMMSQNRQSAKDRSDARLDYEVNVRAEMQIAALHEKLDMARAQELANITRALEEQRALVEDLARRLAERPEGR